jgi:hypothetical protein
VGSRIRRPVWTAAAALLGFIGGCAGSLVSLIDPQPADYPFLAKYAPLPHHVPEYPGGLAFRFAMAQDVIHERFARHGPAHYQERNRLTHEKLAKLAPDDPATFPLADDLAAGLERLGRTGEAVDVMRDKLARQQARGLAGRDLYTSYANLGTFLIHHSYPKAVAGDAAAREQFREGVSSIRQSVQVNPQAHFGRERWQAAVAEFLLAAMDKPEQLKTFDCLGNRLDLGIEKMINRQLTWAEGGYGRPANRPFSSGMPAYRVPAFFRHDVSPDDPSRWPEFSPVRENITKVGAEEGWEKVAVPSHRERVPFDEPVLGIIGMWRQGGGANPHFALALGETMLRVGQRYIAWAAYERASRMAERFWPDPTLQQHLRDHCRKRQSQIEETLSWQPEAGPSPPHPTQPVAKLRPGFEAELAHGEGYQRAYQEFEAERIVAGVSITDEHFFDTFHAGREPIASPVGPEEWASFVREKEMDSYVLQRAWAWGVFGAGLAAMVMALLLRWRLG